MKNNELDLLAPKFGNFSAPTPEHLLMKNQEAIPVNIKLFKAALAGSIAGVQDALIQGGKPDFFFRQEDSKNALHVASESGYLDIVQVLLSHGAVPDCRVASTKDTALILATASGQDEVVEALIGAGAKVNTSKGDLFAPYVYLFLLSGLGNTYGNTPLHEAARIGSMRILKLLLDRGAKINATNKRGSTPLHLFCYGVDEDQFTLEKLRTLIRAGADVNACDTQGFTPFLVCCASGR